MLCRWSIERYYKTAVHRVFEAYLNNEEGLPLTEDCIERMVTEISGSTYSFQQQKITKGSESVKRFEALLQHHDGGIFEVKIEPPQTLKVAEGLDGIVAITITDNENGYPKSWPFHGWPILEEFYEVTFLKPKWNRSWEEFGKVCEELVSFYPK